MNTSTTSRALPVIPYTLRIAHNTATIEIEHAGLRSIIARFDESWICPEHGTIEQHARGILTACNSHAALVAALDETVRQIEVVRLSGYIDECAALDGSLHHTVNAALAALAQAKE